MKPSELADAFFFYLTVPRCVGCGEFLSRRERVFCEKCRMVYDNVKQRSCSRCAARISHCTCPNDHLDTHYVHRLIKVTRYLHDSELPQNKLIYSLKEERRSDVLQFLAEELAASVRHGVEAPEELLVTCVPRGKRSLALYGFDHAYRLARATAKLLGAEFSPLLRSTARRAQKELSGRRERMANATMALRGGRSVAGRRILLIDDIVTTGASMANAAALLRGERAGEIIGAAVAIAYYDPYVPLERT